MNAGPVDREVQIGVREDGQIPGLDQVEIQGEPGILCPLVFAVRTHQVSSEGLFENSNLQDLNVYSLRGDLFAHDWEAVCMKEVSVTLSLMIEVAVGDYTKSSQSQLSSPLK